MEVRGELLQPLGYFVERAPRYPLDERFGGPQSSSGRSGGENNCSQPQRIEPRFLNVMAHSLVTKPCELSRLFYVN
jgi:hypothetical protein